MSHSTPQLSALKVCSKCGEAKPLSEFNFRKSGRKAGKPRSACRMCERAGHAEYRAKNPGVDAAYKTAHRERYTELEAMRRSANREQFNAAMVAYNAKHPDRVGAKNAVNNAIQRGALPPAKTMVCAVCDEAQAQHWHHYNGYSEVNWFDIMPVCLPCHEQEHHRNGK